MNFIQFASSHGLIIGSLHYNKWVRVVTTDHPHKRNGAYFCGGEWGHVQNWATMQNVESWQDGERKSPANLALINARMISSKKEFIKNRAALQRAAAQKAEWILGQCELDLHPYLAAKGWPDAAGNIWKQQDKEPLLVIPMRHNGKICGAQLIAPDESKKFLAGQRGNDAEFVIGSCGVDIYCEGYATGLAIREAVAALKIVASIHVCFSAGNVQRMAKTGIVVADNDESGTGERVAIATGLPYYLPEIVGTDFNDEWKKRGTFAMSQSLKKVLQLVKK